MTATDREVMAEATLAVRRILAQSKDPRTRLGRMSPSGVAFHAAWAAIKVWRDADDGGDGTLPGRPDIGCGSGWACAWRERAGQTWLTRG